MSFGLEVRDGNGTVTLSSNFSAAEMFLDSVTPGITSSTNLSSVHKICVPDTACSLFREEPRKPSGFRTYCAPRQNGVSAVNLTGGLRRSCVTSPYAWASFLFANDSHMQDRFLPTTRSTQPTTVVGASPDPAQDTGFGLNAYNASHSKLISASYANFSLLQETTVSVKSIRSEYSYGFIFDIPVSLTFPRALVKPPLLFVKDTTVPISLFDFTRDNQGRYTGARLICAQAIVSGTYPGVDTVTTGSCSVRVYEDIGEQPIPDYGIVVFNQEGQVTYHSGGKPLLVGTTDRVLVDVFVEAKGYYDGYGFATFTWADAHSASVGGAWVALTGHPLVGCITVPETIDFWYHREVFIGLYVFNSGGTMKLQLRPTANVRIYYYSGWICMLNYVGTQYEASIITTT